MAEYNGKELTPELIQKAESCESVEELLALAADNGIQITAEEAQAYLDELSSPELSLDDLSDVAGGVGGEDVSCNRVCYLVNGCDGNFNPSYCPKACGGNANPSYNGNGANN